MNNKKKINNKKCLEKENYLNYFIKIIFVIENIFIFNFVVKKTIEKALDSELPFIKKCINGIILNQRNFRKTDIPLISVVVPCYNCHKYLKSAMRSIQNQCMVEIEIIIVNDYSETETVNLINELKNEDPRIEVYNNKRNMGLLYTRCSGVLKAKGKYVLTLDGDDLFFGSDVFDSLYSATEEGKFDIIASKVIDAYDSSDRKKIKDNIFNKKVNFSIFKPELSCYAITKNTRNKKIPYNDINIWGKLIKTDVYQSAINILGKERYSTFINWEEDAIMIFIITNVANSYKYIQKYCLFHYYRNGSTSDMEEISSKYFATLRKIDIIFELSKKECKYIAAKKLIGMKNAIHRLSSEGKIFFNNTLTKIAYSKEINFKYIKKIKNIYKNYLPNI